jgi:hypothetical protein
VYLCMAPSKSPEWCPEHEHRSGGRADRWWWRRRRSGQRGGGTNSEIRIKKTAGKERRQIAGRRNPRKRIRGGGSQAIGGGSARTPSGFAIRNPEVGFKWREEKESHLNGGRDLELGFAGGVDWSRVEDGGSSRGGWSGSCSCSACLRGWRWRWDGTMGVGWPGPALVDAACVLLLLLLLPPPPPLPRLSFSRVGRKMDGWMGGRLPAPPLLRLRCPLPVALPCLASLYLTPQPTQPGG